MTLNTTTPLHAGHDQFDVASLVTDAGVHYECFVYLNRNQYRVEAYCQRTQPGGGDPALVFHSYVATGAADAGATNGYPVDCPKIIAVGQTFVVHWLQAATVSEGFREWELFRASMDMADFNASSAGWTQHSSVDVYDNFALYDVCPVLGSATDFVVARSTAEDEITVQRFDGFEWLDNDWDAFIARDHAPRVLGVYAHDSDNDVLVSYERTDGGNALELWTAHLDADDGGSFADVKTYNALADANFVQVGFCRVASNRVVVMAECLVESVRTTSEAQPSLQHIHLVAARMVNSDSAARSGNEHWVNNVYMASRPWAYDNGNTSAGGGVNVYSCLAYRSVHLTNEWEQAVVFAVNWDFEQWDSVSDGGGLRPRPIATWVQANIPDARTSGWHPESNDLLATFGSQKRVNHISYAANPPPYGPDIKTRKVAIGAFARLGNAAAAVTDPYLATANGATASEFVPQNLGCSEFTVYMEDPWTIFRDASDPTQPEANFAGAYARSMFQTCQAGRSLFISGGTPYLYDGKQPVECGWLWNPEIFYLDPNNHASGNMNPLAGTPAFQYYAVYSWRDAQGQVHRSGPSRVVQIELGGTDDSVDLRVRSMSMSMRDATAYYPLAEEIQIEIYRTEGDSETGLFYRVFGQLTGTAMRVRDTPLNNPTATYIAVTDLLSDANLVLQGLGPYQYAEDGVTFPTEAAPQTTPAMTCCASWLNRVFASSALDPSVIYYTDEIFPDYGSDFYQAPFFRGAQTFRIGEVGEVIAMQAMDNYLVLFTQSHIFTMGASDAGGGLLTLDATVRHTGVGCIEPKSVVLSPTGIYFQSAKGLKLLDRGFGIVDVGFPVDDDIRAAGNIRAATINEGDHEARFTCNGALVSTYVTTFTVSIAAGNALGDWIIDIDGEMTVAALAGTTATAIADSLHALISARLGDTGDLRQSVASVSSPGGTVVVTWVDDVTPEYSSSTSSGGSLNGVDVLDQETRPRVLVHNYAFDLWTRFDLVQTNTNTRMAETVDACAWRGLDGGVVHAVLCQGALLLERLSNDPFPYRDQTSTGNVGVPIDVETAWLKLSGMSGWKRIRRIGLQTDRINDAALTVDLSFDVLGNERSPQVQTGIAWTAAPAYDLIKPRQQKMSGIKIRVYESSGITDASETVALYGFSLIVGVKKGLRKVGDAQIGAS